MRGKRLEITFSVLTMTALACVGFLLFGVRKAVIQLDERIVAVQTAYEHNQQPEKLTKIEERLQKVEHGALASSQKTDQLTREIAAMRALMADMRNERGLARNDPVLKTAYILPVPPVNVGRTVQYE